MKSIVCCDVFGVVYRSFISVDLVSNCSYADIEPYHTPAPAILHHYLEMNKKFPVVVTAFNIQSSSGAVAKPQLLSQILKGAA